MRTNVRRCARCKGDHDGIEWHKLTRPIVRGGDDPKATLYTHWAACPTNGEPILMLVRAKVAKAEPSS